MTEARFKVGDKVKLIDSVISMMYSGEYGFTGNKDEVFTIKTVKIGYSYTTYNTVERNWCKEKWLELVIPIHLGGE